MKKITSTENKVSIIYSKSVELTIMEHLIRKYDLAIYALQRSRQNGIYLVHEKAYNRLVRELVDGCKRQCYKRVYSIEEAEGLVVRKNYYVSLDGFSLISLGEALRIAGLCPPVDTQPLDGDRPNSENSNDNDSTDEDGNGDAHDEEGQVIRDFVSALVEYVCKEEERWTQEIVDAVTEMPKDVPVEGESNGEDATMISRLLARLNQLEQRVKFLENKLELKDKDARSGSTQTLIKGLKVVTDTSELLMSKLDCKEIELQEIRSDVADLKASKGVSKGGGAGGYLF